MMYQPPYQPPETHVTVNTPRSTADRVLSLITSMSALGIFLILAFPIMVCVGLSLLCLIGGALSGSGH